MTSISKRRAVAAIIAATCVAAPVSAAAYSLPSTYKSDAAQSTGAGAQWASDRSDAAQSSGIAAKRAGAYPPSGFNGGDNPADRVAPTAVPMTVEVVRPERTIVRNVDAALPLVLSGSALLLVIAGLGFTLISTGSAPRLGRSH